MPSVEDLVLNAIQEHPVEFKTSFEEILREKMAAAVNTRRESLSKSLYSESSHVVPHKPEETEEPLDLGGFQPKPEDEKKFVGFHKVKKTPDANGNGDDVFKGTTKKHYDPKHGYENPEDKTKYFAPAGVNEDLNEEYESDNYKTTHDKMGHVTLLNKKTGKDLYIQGDDATEFRRVMNRMKTNKVPTDKVDHHLSGYDDVMKEEHTPEQLDRKIEFHSAAATKTAGDASKMMARGNRAIDLDRATAIKTEAASLDQQARLHGFAAKIAKQLKNKLGVE